MREQRRPPFSETERHGLLLLLPHVTRAKAVHARLQMLEGSTSVLNALDVALVFTTGSGELVHCTGAAEAIVEKDDGLSISNRRLHATEPSADARLRDALRAVTSAVQTADAPMAVTIERPSLKRPYRLLLSPLRSGLMQFTGMRQPDVALIVLDPENPRPAAVNLLKRVYGLTDREAALASVLSTGVSVEEAADTLGMAYETARSHLRRIFAKTDTSRQPELMLLLSRFPKD
jgi:DNA-binding CsgD family transcriptional regulator